MPVNIVTKKAEHSFSVSANAEYEWFDSGANGILIRGVLNMPLVEDKLALRVAFLTNFDDGQMEIRSERNRQQLSKADLGALRASLRWEPLENVTVDLIGGWLRTDGSGEGVKFQGNYPTPPPPNSAGAGAGVDFTGALRNPKDPYRGTADEPQRSDATVYTATLLVAWQAENFKFDSITGYQSTDFFLHRDQDTSSLPISVLELTDKSRQISQEFLVNSTWDKPVNYTIGAIYQYDWTPQTLIDVFYDQDTTLATPILLLPGLPILPGAGLPEGLSLVDNCPIPTSFFVFDPSCPPSNWPETPTRTSFTPWPKSRTTSSGSTPISAGRSSTI